MRFALLLLSLLFSLTLQTYAFEVTGLLTEHLKDPIGIDNPNPRFSWRMDDNRQGAGQSLFRVLVSTDSIAFNNHLVWDSGDMVSGDVLIRYSGQRLVPFAKYWWKVICGDMDGVRIESPLASFEMGMMEESSWRGHWISDSRDRDYKPAPRFRKEFSIHGKVVCARAYIAAAGIYTLNVNGRRIVDRVLDPAFTRYDRRILYSTLDITGLIKEGDNAMGVELGNGWYNHQPSTTWRFDKAPWRARPAFCMDVRVKYEDGTCETITTDMTWRTSSDGPVIYNNIYVGEHFDARKLQHGWTEPGFDDTSWDVPVFRSCPAGMVSSQSMYPIRESAEKDAVRIIKLRPTRWIYDFGENMAGNIHLRIKGEKGSTVRLTYAEKLSVDDRADQSGLDVYYYGDGKDEPFQTDMVIMSGDEDYFAPAYSYKGFRYVEVNTGAPLEMGTESIRAVSICSDVPKAGYIHSSNHLVESIADAARKSYLSNLIGYPTDCPQREKNGWTGDAHLAIETGLYNYDAFTVYEKWLCDHRDEQQPNGILPDIIPTGGWGYQPISSNGNGLDWTSTIAIIPWNLYLFYGDSKPLYDCYFNIRRYVDYALSLTEDGLCSWGRGDWVAVTKRADKTLITSCFLYQDLQILVRAARLFGYGEDEEKYASIASTVRDAINNHYLDVSTGFYAEGMQTEQSLPLMSGVVPDELRGKVAAALEQRVKADGYHINAGVHGSKTVLAALCANGYAESAYRIATAEDYPSWGWWIRNGHKTLIENWALDAPRDNSLNHVMFGDISAWFFRSLGGIMPDPDAPGFRHVFLRPCFPKAQKQFECMHKTPYGDIIVRWVRKGRRINCSVVVPCGCSATFIRPGGETEELTAGKHDIIVFRGE